MSTPLHHAAQKALAALEVCTGRTTGAGVMRVRAIAEVREALANVDQTNTSAGRVQKPPGNRQVMQMALDALGAMKDAMLDQGVNTDPAHPNRMALNYGVTAMRKLRAALAAPQGEPVAKAWGEGYRQGVADERTSEANIGIAGFGAKVNPARVNPYDTAPQPAAPVQPPKFPTMLRKMWSGSEVQQWINDNWEPK